MQCRYIFDLWSTFDVEMLQILILNDDMNLFLATSRATDSTKCDDGNSGELSHLEIY